MKFDVTGLTRKNEREENQDVFQYTQFQIGEEEAILLTVADGMGGMENGKQISNMASWTFQTSFFEQMKKMALPQMNTIDNRNIEEILLKSMQKTQEELLDFIQNEHISGGSTLTAALLIGNKLYSINVGDSPCYLFRDGDFKVHMLANMENKAYKGLEKGIYTSRHSAEFKRESSYLMNYIGCLRYKIPSVQQQHIYEDNIIILGSDGAFGTMEEQEIYDCINNKDLKASIYNLIDNARNEGATDNQTLIMCKVIGEK